MLTQVAWRNVWRSKVRSLVVITAISLGLIAGIFLMSFSWGMNTQRTRDIIETRTSHIQIHQKHYKDDRKMSLFIPQGMKLLDEVKTEPEVKAATARILANGMISNARGGFGVQINGIIPEEEAKVTKLDTRVVAGEYFEGLKTNPILIGDKLAEKMGWKEIPEPGAKNEDGSPAQPTYQIRKKVVLAFQAPGGKTKYSSFKVVGVYKSINSKFDESNVFVQFEDLNRLTGTENQAHEIGIMLNDQNMAEDSTFLASLAAGNSQLLVENWKDISPDLKLIDETFAITVYIFMGIILLALLFGIVNTMLMAVMERTKELGMLMAIGMNKDKIFSMIMLETIFLSTIGGPIGLLLGYGLVRLFGNIGIDLSSMAEAGAQMGIGTMVYTDLETHYYFQIALMVVVTALIAAIYPAYKALQLKPVEAIRSI
ncbi:MAG: ABC transporter permease [Bacteroidetes bacterium]|nr:ABC transporter permease [Bacteroidota bacterium]